MKTIAFECSIWYVGLLLTGLFLISYSTEMLNGPNIVYPKLIESRSYSGGKVVKLADDLTLNLEKSSVLDKRLLLRTYEGQLMRHTYLDGEVLEENLYHDAKRFASIMISEEDSLKVEGILGPKLIIRPLVGRERTVEGNVPHDLYEYNEDTLHEEQDLDVGKTRTNFSARHYQQQGAIIPKVVYVELLIAVDSKLRSQFSTEDELLKYITISFNSVNVRYMTVSQPSVKLKIRALEIFQASQEYFLYRAEDVIVAGLRTLEYFRDYVNQNPDKYRDYDAVYLMTGLDLAGWKRSGWDRSLQGIAYVGGACGYEKVGLGEDKAGTYMGVRIHAHEIGHLLGCPHDGYEYGQFTSVDCPWSDSYIMSYSEQDSRSMKFSKCCNNMMTQMVTSPQGQCLLELNAKRKIKKKRFSRKLPGDIYTRDEICKRAFPHVPETRFMVGSNGDAQCHARCYMPEWVFGSETFRFTFLPDHSQCNSSGGKYCINGDCKQHKKKYEEYRPAK